MELKWILKKVEKWEGWNGNEGLVGYHLRDIYLCIFIPKYQKNTIRLLSYDLLDFPIES